MECSYCQDNVSMPFTCSLCSKKHCSKHRLPETHECANLGHFDTDTYRKQKLAKSRLPQNTITASSFATVGGYDRGRGNFWTSGDRNRDVLYAGLMIGLIAIMRFIRSIETFIELLPVAMLYSVFGMFTIYYFRRRSCAQHGLDTKFMFWPIGIALTLIFSIFRPFWILIGYFFIEGEATLESRGRIGILSSLTSMGVFFFSILLASFFPFLIDYGLFQAASIFILIALLNLIPLWGLDGQYILEWEPKYYWPMLILSLILLLFFGGIF